MSSLHHILQSRIHLFMELIYVLFYLLDVCLLQFWYSAHKDRFMLLVTVPDMFLNVKIMNEEN